MAYAIQFTNAALRQLRKLPPVVRQRVADGIKRLARDPRPSDCRELQGSPYYRIRVGDYRVIYDVSGDPTILDALVARLAPGGEIVLAGFYDRPLAFAFPPAFMREARLRVAAQWRPDDLKSVIRLVEDGRLSLEGLITHRRFALQARDAYPIAFDDPRCLKMVLDWRAVA